MSDGRRRTGAFPGLHLLLAIEEEGWERRLGGDAEEAVHRAAEAALAGAGLPRSLDAELSVLLADDGTVRALNAQWRGKDKPTNILSFPARALGPGEAPGPLLGDLALAFETCAAEADAEGKAFADHFAHLIVHGVLHLLGHDHEDERQAERMEALEISILSGLSIGDPYREAREEPAA